MEVTLNIISHIPMSGLDLRMIRWQLVATRPSCGFGTIASPAELSYPVVVDSYPE